MPANDQGPFAMAVDNTKFNPFILPLNWNFRPIWHTSFFGPIKIWHDYSDPPPIISELNGYYENWTREWAQKLNTEYKPK
jgi:hypothetical protein